MSSLLVDTSAATTKQLLIHLLERFDLFELTLDRLETRMSDLTASVDNLQRAVDGVAQRTLVEVQALQQNLADTRERLATALADDERAASLLAESEAAVARINSSVDQLNALGADPSTPVGPVQPGNENSIPVNDPVVVPETGLPDPVSGTAPGTGDVPIDPQTGAPVNPTPEPPAPADAPTGDPAPADQPSAEGRTDAPVDTPAPTPADAPVDTPTPGSAGVSASPTPDA